MNKDIFKLQNGSDIRGIAIGDDANLTKVESFLIGSAFAKWLSKLYGKKELTVSIGHDPRITAEELKDAMIKGLCSQEINVLDAGLSSTPAMFMSTLFEKYQCDGAIMITASHLPFNRNGFKFFSKNGGLEKGDIKEILTIASEGTLDLSLPSIYRKIDLLDTYSEHLRNLISEGEMEPLKGLNIVVDAGNGAGGFFATKVLKPLGADITGSQFLEPDGTFPNHQPNPENKDAMKSISNKVKETGADLGLIFDTDVDRSSAVDGNGDEISRNAIVALAAALGSKAGTVVTDSITSNELKEFLEKNLGLKHLRYMRGYRNVINKGMEIDDCFLAIETSGHAAYRENYFLDDGAYLAVKIVIEAAKLKRKGLGINKLIEDLKHPANSIEHRIKISGENSGEVGNLVIKDLTEFAERSSELSLELPNYEGVRVNFEGGWFLLRKSLHDPVMPLNIEASSEESLSFAEKMIKEFLNGYEELDTTMIK